MAEAVVSGTGQLVDAVVSAVKVGKEIGSDLNSGMNQLKINTLTITLDAKKIVYIKKKIQHELDRCSKVKETKSISQMKERLHGLLDRLKLLEDGIEEMGHHKNKFSRPKIIKASGVDKMLERIHQEVLDIDNEFSNNCIPSIRDIFTSELDCKSLLSTYSQTDFPTPVEVTDIKVRPQRKQIIVDWIDDKNQNVKEYHIFVTKEFTGVPETCICTVKQSPYSENLRKDFEEWCTYFVTVCAVNKAGSCGLETTPVGVYMNQNPPDVKPCGLKVLPGSSNNSIKIRVNRPDRYDELGIKECMLYGKKKHNNTKTKLDKPPVACVFSPAKEKQEIEVPDLDPDTEYSIKICFRNEWGVDIKYLSDELPPFMIKAIPSTPVISYKETARDDKTVTVLLKFETKENAGSVSSYQLWTRTKKSDDWSNLLSTEEDHIEHKLERKKTYFYAQKTYFYVVSISVGGIKSEDSNILEIKTK